MADQLRVSKQRSLDAGSCNFCTRDHWRVFELSGDSPHCTLVVRMCSKCVTELKAGVNRVR